MSRVTDMERFFDLFEDRKLAADLFTIVEDARIDFLIRHEYGGIRSALGRVQLRELEKRKPVEQLPLREALVENLIRVSLDPNPSCSLAGIARDCHEAGAGLSAARCSIPRPPSRTRPRRRWRSTTSWSTSPT